MKWNSNTIGSPAAPKPGDKREKISFALFPVKIQDNWVWLESFIKVQEYKTVYGTYVKSR